MDATIRNLDEKLYRRLRARAAATGATIGSVMNEAIARYLALPYASKRGSILDIVPEPYPPGNERLGEQIDAIVYGG